MEKYQSILVKQFKLFVLEELLKKLNIKLTVNNDNFDVTKPALIYKKHKKHYRIYKKLYVT